MAKSVARPIALRAGRWSIHPRSKGNFVFSFDGCIRFEDILPYEHLLLNPFHGTGQLCPSMGWTRFVAHGVPVWAVYENWVPFGPQELLQEARALPGLKKATFAMQPRWLKPVGSIETEYSSVTFAVSDPDGTITNTLLNNRTALFGKEVTVHKWVDKPALVQCSRCHALGHNKASKACTLSRESVKCHICGGAHRSESHDRYCLRKHAVIGICDCKHFRCLNCQKTGHDCRNAKCPARDLYRPRGTRRAAGTGIGGKGKERAMDPDSVMHPPGQAAPPPNAVAGPSRRRAASLTPSDLDKVDKYMDSVADHDTLGYWPDNDFGRGPRTPPPPSVHAAPGTAANRVYSPSRSTGDANHETLA
jgi:hypothetical protein